MIKKITVSALFLFTLALSQHVAPLYGEFDPYKALEGLFSILKGHYTCSAFRDDPGLFAKLISDSDTLIKQDAVNDLLACGAQVNALPAFTDNPRELTPLMVLLLNHGKDPEIVDVVKSLLAHGADAKARAHYGETPLYYAIKYSMPEVVEELLKAGADANAQLSYDLSTPLHTVFGVKGALDEKNALVKSLIAHGANPKLADKEGLTPLHLAVKENLRFNAKDSRSYHRNFVDQLAIVRELVKAGANINAQNNSGETPLMFAAYYNADPDLIRFMLINGANKTIKNKFGKTVIDFLEEESKSEQYAELPHYINNVYATIDIINQVKSS